MFSDSISIHHLGRQPYEKVWQSMKHFTEGRTDEADQIWVVEHDPVYTQGLAGKPEHILLHNDIPIIQTDRGGQVTYHGPGQLVIYPLINIRRAQFDIRYLITALEQSVIDMLQQYDIEAHAKKEAPGVYVNEAKIASLAYELEKGAHIMVSQLMLRWI